VINKIAIIIMCTLASQIVVAHECWALTHLQGYMAMSTEKYAFTPDKFSNPIILCFNENNSGSVTGDDTMFAKFGSSTLIGIASNKGIELVETYQIDRKNQKVLFTKSRIGTNTVIPNGPDVVSAFVGNAKILNP